MPNASEVVPGAWSNLIVLFDNGWYSAVWGQLRDSTHRDLGVRWNGSEGQVGYPSARRYPQWYVEPPILHEALLLGFHKHLLTLEDNPAHRLYLSNIQTAFREALQQKSIGSVPDHGLR